MRPYTHLAIFTLALALGAFGTVQFAFAYERGDSHMGQLAFLASLAGYVASLYLAANPPRTGRR